MKNFIKNTIFLFFSTVLINAIRTKYKVRSGELNKTVRAKNRTEAVLKAVKRHRKNLSQIIMITEKGKKEFDESYFFATEDILKKLNFEIVKE